jgi:hypothetical protein
LPLVRRLVVALPVVVPLRLASPFIKELPHASILDPPSSFAPADCSIAYICTASASRRAATTQLAVLSSLRWTSVTIVVVIVSCCAIAIVVDDACRVVAIVDGVFFDVHAHFVLYAKKSC